MAIAMQSRSFTSRLGYSAASLVRCGIVMAFACVVFDLSLHNAVRTPLFDGMRAGSYLLRTRKGALTQLVRCEPSFPKTVYDRAPGVSE